jgi:hypothetical protein
MVNQKLWARPCRLIVAHKQQLGSIHNKGGFEIMLNK